MRVVKRSELLKMPHGTLFADYTPDIIGSLKVFADSASYSNDFCYRELICVDAHDSNEHFDIMEDAIEKGTSVKLDHEGWSRDGMFESMDRLYVVFEPADIIGFIISMQKALLNFDKEEKLKAVSIKHDNSDDTGGD